MFVWKVLNFAVMFLFGVEVDLPERPLPPEMVVFYITQDTQRHPLLPEIKTGLSSTLEIS